MRRIPGRSSSARRRAAALDIWKPTVLFRQLVDDLLHLVAPLEDALDLALVEPASDCGGQARFIERLHLVPELGVDLDELVVKSVAGKRARVIDQNQVPGGIDEPVPEVRI